MSMVNFFRKRATSNIKQTTMTEEQERFREFKEHELANAAKVKPEDILTEQETHEFGLEILFKQVQKEGYEVISVNTDLNQHPQMVLKKDGQVYFVMVKTVPSNQDKDVYQARLAGQLVTHSKQHNAKVLFAGIGLHCLTTGHILTRGAPFVTNYTGMIDLDFHPIELEEMIKYGQYQRVKKNLDGNFKPKSEVEKRVETWLNLNYNNIIAKNIREGIATNIQDMKIEIENELVTDLMTVYHDLIFDE